MLVKAVTGDVAKYGDFAYALALRPKKSSYPTCCDGIKTRADFMAAAERAVSGETSELLLFSLDGTVEGWSCYEWIPSEHYLQLTGFHVNRATERALTELLARLEAEFSGYTAYFGFPSENTAALGVLAALGFRCVGEYRLYVKEL